MPPLSLLSFPSSTSAYDPLNPVISHFSLHPLDDLSRTHFRSLLPFPPSSKAGGCTICLSYSHGHLILLRRRVEPALADVFTGAEIHLPALPPDRFSFYYATLTAPPASPGCRLLLFFSKHALFCCRIHDRNPECTQHRLPQSGSFIVRVLSYKERILAVNERAKLLILQFDPSFKAEALDVGWLQAPPAFDRLHFGPQLVECGWELLLVLFVLNQ